MKKRQLIIGCFLSAITVSCTSTLEPPERDMFDHTKTVAAGLVRASAKAEQCLNLLEDSHTRSINRVVNKIEYLTKTRSENSQQIAILNYAEGGFAVVGYTTDTEMVYGFSNEGSLNLNDTINNPALAAYLGSLGDFVIVPPETVERNVGTASKLSPLINNEARFWSQGAPYNQYCNGYKAGHIAVSMAIFLSHYNKPETIGGYTMDWQGMKANRLHENASRLIRELGKAEYLNVKYGIPTGDFREERIIPTLRKVSWGEALTNMVQDSDYSKDATSHILNLLHPEETVKPLSGKSHEPALVTGTYWTLTDWDYKQYYYSWVIDGSVQFLVQKFHKDQPDKPFGSPFPGKTYFHCIWGNGGSGNGYFYISGAVLTGGQPMYYGQGDSNSSTIKDYAIKQVVGGQFRPLSQTSNP